MRFYPAEPDLETIFNRIRDEDIDLQPDFQRGEVWSDSKRQRLIDSILRGWVVPPILVVATPGSTIQQVLDGQQRLAAIRDFKLNKLQIDGKIEPIDKFIVGLDGLYYDQLPKDVAKAFDRYTLKVYELREYRPEEPAEIFFRLNQATALTSAEKRNAFFGPVRDQIRELVERFEKVGMVSRTLGFSNSRMAYDDVLARVACTFELGTLHSKITAGSINQMYRRPEPIASAHIWRIDRALRMLLDMIETSRGAFEYSSGMPRFNKATLYSWLVFLARIRNSDYLPDVGHVFTRFERLRTGVVYEKTSESPSSERTPENLLPLIMVYTDRATSRVADVNSVLLRDMILWLFAYVVTSGKVRCPDEHPDPIPNFWNDVKGRRSLVGEDEAMDFILKTQWGARV